MTMTLLDLIEDHRIAFDAHIEAIDHDNEINDDDSSARLDAASDAEDAMLTEVCAYQCETLDEARIKAEYLLSMPDDLQDRHFAFLLESFGRGEEGDT